MSTVEQEIGILLRQYKLTLGTVESATGGLISHRITNIPGSSDYYLGGIISYSNEIKMQIVGVRERTLKQYGAVSAQVVRQMAAGGRKVLGADICIADSGIAGPGGDTPGKPLGLFYFGLSHKGSTYSRKQVFQGDRQANKQQASEFALNWLLEYLQSLSLDMTAESALPVKSVVTCFLESDGKILILRRSQKVGTYQGKWAGISGYIESEPDSQAFLEIREETGLSKPEISLIRKGAPLEVVDPQLKLKWLVHPYLFHVKNPSKIQIDWEHTESRWIPPQEIDQFPAVPGLHTAFLEVWNQHGN